MISDFWDGVRLQILEIIGDRGGWLSQNRISDLVSIFELFNLEKKIASSFKLTVKFIAQDGTLYPKKVDDF